MISNNISRVYFFAPGYILGGGEPLLSYLAKYISEQKNIKIGVIDFKNGALTYYIQKELPKVADIDYVDYDEDILKLEDDSVIVSPAELFCCIKKCSGKNIRILNIFWNIDTGWRILFLPSEIKKWSPLFDKLNGCVFLDYGICLENSRSLRHKFKERIMPLYFNGEYFSDPHEIINKNEINLVWVGRLSESKSWAVMNIIKNYSLYKTEKKKVFHIIGGGEFKEQLKILSAPYKNEIEFKFICPLFGNKLKEYLKTKTDIGIGMGTSILLMSSFAIPTIGCSEATNGKYFDPNFIWVCDEYKYCTGVLKGQTDMSKYAHSLDYLLDEACTEDNIKIIGKKCQEYVKNTHSDLNKIGDLFYKFICETELSYKYFKKVIKFLPHTDCFQSEFSFLGVQLFKIVRMYNKKYFYFLKIRVAKIVNGSDFYINIFGVKIRIVRNFKYFYYSRLGDVPKKRFFEYVKNIETQEKDKRKEKKETKMTNEEFLTEMQDVLQTEEELSMDTVLDDLDEWDSLSVMATMAFLEKSFGVKTTMKDYHEMKTIGDIAKKAGM